MRLPKATLRKSGFRMMTARLEVAIGIDELVNGLCAYAWEYDFASLEKVVTRSYAYELATKTILNRGRDWYPDANNNCDLDESDISRIRVHVRKLFPELTEYVKKN